MSKFYKFEEYLNNNVEGSFALSLGDIEEILGFDLPTSAYQYTAYWNPSETHTLANLILKCGYKTIPNLKRNYIEFYRINGYQIKNHDKEIEESNNIECDIKADISTYVEKFVKVYQSDPNGRYMSYDHIRSNFLKYRDQESQRDFLTLHLYAYLASWGMLRNSFLMQKDYLFSRKVMDVLCSHKYDVLLDFNPYEEISNRECKLVMELADDIRNCYIDKEYYEEGTNTLKKIENVTDTLVSKIILGTIGCTVAYDRYVKVGLSSHGFTQKLSIKSIKELCEFAKTNRLQITRQLNKLNDLYTPMKIIDMYLFEKGFEIELNKVKND